MRDIFTDSDFREQLQYKSLVMLIRNEKINLQQLMIGDVSALKYQSLMLTYQLIEIYSQSLYTYLVLRVGLMPDNAGVEVETILNEIRMINGCSKAYFDWSKTPMNLDVEEIVEKQELAEKKIINSVLEELYNILMSKMIPKFNTEGTQMLFKEILNC